MSICLLLTTAVVRANEFQITTEDELHSENEDVISTLVRDVEVCHLDLDTCESTLQKSLNNGSQISWYQEPEVIAGVGAGAFIVGLLFGSLKK